MPRVNLPTFGMGLKNLLFNQGIDIEIVKENIQTQLSKWVPNVILKNINVDISPDQHQFSFTISYIYSMDGNADNFNDFSEGNPGMMFIEMAAYVGDVLSYYLDTQIQENFLTLAQEEETLYEMAYLYGYTPKITSTANVNLDISQLVPSTTAGSTYVPDYS